MWLEAHLPEDGTLLSDIVSRIVAEGPRHVCKKTCEAALRVVCIRADSKWIMRRASRSNVRAHRIYLRSHRLDPPEAASETETVTAVAATEESLAAEAAALAALLGTDEITARKLIASDLGTVTLINLRCTRSSLQQVNGLSMGKCKLFLDTARAEVPKAAKAAAEAAERPIRAAINCPVLFEHLINNRCVVEVGKILVDQDLTSMILVSDFSVDVVRSRVTYRWTSCSWWTYK